MRSTYPGGGVSGLQKYVRDLASHMRDEIWWEIKHWNVRDALGIKRVL
jgi:hypothetical protein